MYNVKRCFGLSGHTNDIQAATIYLKINKKQKLKLSHLVATHYVDLLDEMLAISLQGLAEGQAQDWLHLLDMLEAHTGKAVSSDRILQGRRPKRSQLRLRPQSKHRRQTALIARSRFCVAHLGCSSKKLLTVAKRPIVPTTSSQASVLQLKWI